MVIKEMCIYTAIELSSQPEIRKGLKDHIYEYGWIVTQPTEKGQRELDIFHSSYRVKHLQLRLRDLNKDTESYQE